MSLKLNCVFIKSHDSQQDFCAKFPPIKEMIKMKKFILILILVASLVFVAGAQSKVVLNKGQGHHTQHHRKHRARHHTPPVEWHGTVAQALAIAERKAYELWGIKPCAGTYKIELVSQEWLRAMSGPLPTTGLISGIVSGLSEWESPSGADSYSSQPGSWAECVMYLDTEDWPEVNPDPFNWHANWLEACTNVLHEWGHLTGHPHSDIPNEPPEPPGTTSEQRRLMHASPEENYHRCGLEP